MNIKLFAYTGSPHTFLSFLGCVYMCTYLHAHANFELAQVALKLTMELKMTLDS